ncbi:unnamed protein product [Protopolystoma xenopodis]|uniref:Cadherin domain-containing protein n=1 Tax=Protopolystoma xenopodis TaxID=117903 RepID=A0A448XIK4_9PLAT|nr:unnamed protein product [Protopolystoma xenopodis]
MPSLLAVVPSSSRPSARSGCRRGPSQCRSPPGPGPPVRGTLRGRASLSGLRPTGRPALLLRTTALLIGLLAGGFGSFAHAGYTNPSACQHLARLQVPEASGSSSGLLLRPSASVALATSNSPVSTGGQASKSDAFQVNLTALLAERLGLTTEELSGVSVHLSDAEESRPFAVAQQQPGGWHRLYAAEPVDREAICDPLRQVTRVAVARACCQDTENLLLPDESSLEVVANAGPSTCCLFVPVTVGSRGTYDLRIDILDINDHAPVFQLAALPLPPVSSPAGRAGLGLGPRGPVNSLTFEQIPSRSEVGSTSGLRLTGVLAFPENAVAGDWLQLPAAADSDSGENSRIVYLLANTRPAHLWSLHFRLLQNVASDLASLVTSGQPSEGATGAGSESGTPTDHVAAQSDSSHPLLGRMMRMRMMMLMTTGPRADVAAPAEHEAIGASTGSTDQPTGMYQGPGLLLLQPVDRATVARFSALLIATDQGQPVPLSATIGLQIRVSPSGHRIHTKRGVKSETGF